MGNLLIVMGSLAIPNPPKQEQLELSNFSQIIGASVDRQQIGIIIKAVDTHLKLNLYAFTIPVHYMCPCFRTKSCYKTKHNKN